MARQANAEVDELFEVKTYYYIGAYQQCLNEINKLSRVNFLFLEKVILAHFGGMFTSIIHPLRPWGNVLLLL